MNLSIIIPNYNGGELLKKNLPAVYEAVKSYKKGNVEIIIPDDPSTDNSEKIINNFIENMKEKNIIGKTIRNKNKKNAGFSKNVNRGVSMASGDILILLNTDVAPHKDFLHALLPHLEQKNVFAVGCMEESIEKGHRVFRGRGIGKWEKGFLQHAKGDNNKADTLWASGGSSAFNRRLWDEVGGLENIYNPFYWEDIDISYRALKIGYKVLFEKNSNVTHEHEKGAIRSIASPMQIKKIAYRNQFIFVWMNITDAGLLLSHAAWFPYHCITSAMRADFSYHLGFLLALMKLPSILSKRSKYTKYFKKTDKQILAEFKD